MKHFQEITILIAVEDFGTGSSCGLDAVVDALEGLGSDGISLLDYSNPVDKIQRDKETSNANNNNVSR